MQSLPCFSSLYVVKLKVILSALPVYESFSPGKLPAAIQSKIQSYSHSTTQNSTEQRSKTQRRGAGSASLCFLPVSTDAWRTVLVSADTVLSFNYLNKAIKNNELALFFLLAHSLH
jgi:hypothetical protein